MKSTPITYLVLAMLLTPLAYLAQDDNAQRPVDQYQDTRLEGLPRLDEGTRNRKQTELDTIASDLERNAEGSFDQHLVSYMNSDEKVKDAYHLQQAMALRPEDKILIGEAIEFYGMTDDRASVGKMAEKLRTYGLYRKHARYYADMEELLGPDDILFTNGEQDTRPLLMQRSHSQSDYEIVRIGWLSDPLYRDELRARGIDCPQSYSSPSQFIRAVTEANPGRSTLLSPTLDHGLLRNLGQLQVDGLCFSLDTRHAGTIADDYELIKASFEAKDIAGLGAVSMNYLPLLRSAKVSFDAEGNSTKSAEVALLIEQILQANGKGDQAPSWKE